MKRKKDKHPVLAQWKQIKEKNRQQVKQLEKKVRQLEDMLYEKPITPERLKLLGKDVESVLPKEETLQQRMCRYCDLAGYEYRKKGLSIEYDTPSGTIVTIYPTPVRYCGYSQKWDVYGHFDSHERWGVRFIDEPKAKYLYDLLGKKIEELEQNSKEED